ncbi:hypothetical protein BZA70DRAFT_289367 [Myxozyma melibiosi]|uniref:INO80 complex subunit B-like conserved region domain-containing protein n=1 Tax=Myxozyma melibiosi TaxID=54550 RepID=A0ABR1F6H7_9ASCO
MSENDVTQVRMRSQVTIDQRGTDQKMKKTQGGEQSGRVAATTGFANIDIIIAHTAAADGHEMIQSSKDHRSRDRPHRHSSTEAERDSRSSHKRRRESLSPDRDSGSEESEGEWVVAAPPPPPSALSGDAVSKSESRDSTNGNHPTDEVAADSDSDDSEIVGPTLPSSLKGRKGPTLPTVSDVQHQNSEIMDASLEEMRLARLRALEAAETNLAGAVDNLIAGGFNDPSAGPRDKKAEKRKMANEDRKAYIRALSPGGVDEVGDDELFEGSVGEGPKEKLSEIAQRRAEKERIKRERREAKFRERDAERRERWSEMKIKEEKTLAMLKELAKQRFGE